MSSPHEVQWTHEAVARFWDYQSRRPSISNIYFSALHCPECGATFHIWQHQRSWSAASLTERVEGRGFVAVRVEAMFLEPLRVRFALWLARKLGISKRQPPNLVGIFRRIDASPATTVA